MYGCTVYSRTESGPATLVLALSAFPNLPFGLPNYLTSSCRQTPTRRRRPRYEAQIALEHPSIFVIKNTLQSPALRLPITQPKMDARDQEYREASLNAERCFQALSFKRQG